MELYVDLHIELILRGIFYVLSVIALSMAVLFPELCFILPVAAALMSLYSFFYSEIHSGYLFLVRSVCKLE